MTSLLNMWYYNRSYVGDKTAALRSYAQGSDIAEDEELPVG